MADRGTRRTADPERQRLARDAADVIKQAASILQKEVTDSSTAAGSVQEKFSTTRRVDHGEFKALADRVRGDVHDLIAIAAEMFTELRTDEVQGLVERFATDAHDVVDTTMNLVEHTPEAANRFASFGFTTPTTTPSPVSDPAGAGVEPPPDVPPEDPGAGTA
jgi:uncharacterized protein (DUF1778 family)